MSIARRVPSFEAIAGACASLDFALWQVAAMRSSGNDLAPLIARGVSAVLFGAWSGFRAHWWEFHAAEFLLFEAPYLVLLTGWCAQGMTGGDLVAFAAMLTALTLLLSLADFALWSLGEPFGAMLRQPRVDPYRSSRSLAARHGARSEALKTSTAKITRHAGVPKLEPSPSPPASLSRS